MTAMGILILCAVSILQCVFLLYIVTLFDSEPKKKWKAALLILLGGPIAWVISALMFIPFEEMLEKTKDWFQN